MARLIPAKKYTDKVRERLKIVHQRLQDEKKLKRYLDALVGPFEGKGTNQDWIDALQILLGKDVPSVIDAVDKARQLIHQDGSMRIQIDIREHPTSTPEHPCWLCIVTNTKGLSFFCSSGGEKPSVEAILHDWKTRRRIFEPYIIS